MTQNSINNKDSEFTIDPGSSGDSFAQFNINNSSKFRIGVYDTDDSFRISQGSSLGTNDVLRVFTDGNRTWPLNSISEFSNNTLRTNVTGDGTTYTMVFDTVLYDRNSNLSSSTTFTAPVDGIYQVSGSIALSGITSSHTDGNLLVNGPSINQSLSFNFNPFVLVSSTGVLVVPINGTIDLSQNDTVTLDITVSGGTKVVDSPAAVNKSFFSIFLVG